jgi:hypothetical protein
LGSIRTALHQVADALLHLELGAPHDAEVHQRARLVGLELERRAERERRLVDLGRLLEADAVGQLVLELLRRQLDRLAQVLEPLVGAAGADQRAAPGVEPGGVGALEVDHLAGDLDRGRELAGADQRVGVDQRAVGVGRLGLVVALGDADRVGGPVVLDQQRDVFLDRVERELGLLGLAVLGVGRGDVAGGRGGAGRLQHDGDRQRVGLRRRLLHLLGGLAAAGRDGQGGGGQGQGGAGRQGGGHEQATER